MHAPAHSDSLQHPHAAPISDKKRQANQANAQKSTGPRTPQGKQIASQNALRHGGFSADTLLPSEDPKPFYHFRRAWIAEFSPQNCSELFLTERAVSLAWRLNRLTQADTGLHFNALCDFENAVENHHKQNQSDLDHPATDSLPPAMALADAFESDSKPNPFDRLSKTEDRLQSMLHRILKQLQTLQKQRKDNPPPPCPFLPEEDPDEIDLDESQTQTEEFPQIKPTEHPEANNPDAEETKKAHNEPTIPQPKPQIPQNQPIAAPTNIAIPLTTTEIPPQPPA